jgi:hypothetical protein
VDGCRGRKRRGVSFSVSGLLSSLGVWEPERTTVWGVSESEGDVKSPR